MSFQMLSVITRKKHLNAATGVAGRPARRDETKATNENIRGQGCLSFASHVPLWLQNVIHLTGRSNNFLGNAADTIGTGPETGNLYVRHARAI